MISDLDYHHGQRQLRQVSADRAATRKADMLAQAAWLLERARADGYHSLDELLRSNSDRFTDLGREWRRMHPARF